MNVRIVRSCGPIARVWFVLVAGFLVLAARSALTAEPSRPAGFVRISIPAYGRSFLAMPFTPFAPGLGSSTEPALAEGDVALRWNAAEQVYELVPDPAGLSIGPGEGFWVENRQGETRTLALGGWVVLDEERSLALQPALNAIGYPFSIGRPDWLLAQGYWAINDTASEVTWSFSRPYANEFPDEASETIRIDDIDVHSQSATLHIRAPTRAGSAIAVFSKDLVRDEAIETAGAWTAAAEGLLLNDKGELEWTDLDCERVLGRVYVVRSGGGMDAGAMTQQAADAGVSSGGAANEATAPEAQDGAETADSDGDGVADIDEIVRGTDPRDAASAKATFYVDAQRGRDTNLGRRESPFRTIGAAMRWLRPADIVRVASGTYNESVDIGGVDMEFVLEGNVVLEEARK